MNENPPSISPASSSARSPSGTTSSPMPSPGITAQRMLQLARSLIAEGVLKDVVVADIGVGEGRAAAEMLLMGSSIKVAPVVVWDGQPIGDGRPGPVARRLLELWHEDARRGAGQLVPVPYEKFAGAGLT